MQIINLFNVKHLLSSLKFIIIQKIKCAKINKKLLYFFQFFLSGLLLKRRVQTLNLLLPHLKER